MKTAPPHVPAPMESAVPVLFALLLAAWQPLAGQVLQGKVIGYDAYGNPTQVEDGLGTQSTYVYDQGGTRLVGAVANARPQEVSVVYMDDVSPTRYGPLPHGMYVYKNGNGSLRYTMGEEDQAPHLKVRVTGLTHRGAGARVSVGSQPVGKRFRVDFDYKVEKGNMSLLGMDSSNQTWTNWFASGPTPGWEQASLEVVSSTSGNLFFRAPWNGNGASSTTFYLRHVRVYPAGAQAQSATYHALFDLPVRMYGPDGVGTGRTYDAFGRPATVESPSGAVTEHSYHYSATGNGGRYSPLDPNRVARTTVQGKLPLPVAVHRKRTVFSGGSDHASLGDVAFMDEAPAFSVSLWFTRFSGAAGGSTGHGVNNVLIAQSSHADNDNLEIGTQGGHVEVYLDTGPSSSPENTTRTVNAGIRDNVAYHLVLTYSAASDQARLYVDGALIKTWTEWKNALSNSGASPLSIGIARPGDICAPVACGDWGGFEGAIADVRLYDHALSPSQVGALYGGIVSVSYIDGLGRTDGYVANVFGTSFAPPGPVHPASDLDNYYDGTGGGSNHPYSYTQYESSPLARTTQARMPGGAGYGSEMRYGLNTTETFAINGKTWGANTLSKTVLQDPDGKETVAYTDGQGRTVASGTNMDPGSDDALVESSSDLVTKYEYDGLGNLVRSIDPRGLSTTYRYNVLGQLIEKKLPDQTHPNRYCYDDKGRLRFHASPNDIDSAVGYYGPKYGYTYTKYDGFDRPVEVGKQKGWYSFNSETHFGMACANAGIRNDQGKPTLNTEAHIIHSYDGEGAYRGARNLQGRLTRTKSLGFNYGGTPVWNTAWYSYNELGLVEWLRRSIAPTLHGSITALISYEYDPLGRVAKTSYEEGANTFYQWYEYDGLGRLQYVYSGTGADPAGRTIEAAYTYYADGQVKQLELGGGAQTVDRTYTVQGWLDKINNGNVSAASAHKGDRFGLDLAYSHGGNISRQRWRQAGEVAGARSYHYGYDNAGRLTKACYGAVACTSSGDYDVTYGHDKNGNVSFIGRNGASRRPDLDYLFSFVSGTNKVGNVRVDGISSATKTFGYDANGNMTKNGVQGITGATYDWRNLPTRVTANGSTVHYKYDEDGQRTMKSVGWRNADYYVRGAGGQVLAVYGSSGHYGSPNLRFYNIMAGGEVIGNLAGDGRRYFLKDHLGSVRTTVDRNGNIVGRDDYYPFGLAMPGRSSNIANPNDTYKFTGYEKDDEGGLDLYHANARGYDPVLGRFMRIDPLHMERPGLSTYNYVQNNPLNRVDPTGLLDVYYDEYGNYLGEDELETDYIWITSKENFEANLAKGGSAIQANSTAITDAKLSLEGWSNLFTDVYEKAGYNTGNLIGGKVQVANWINVQDPIMDSASEIFTGSTEHAMLKGSGIITTWMDNKSKFAIFTAQVKDNQLSASYLNTANNLQSLFHHEFQHYYDMRVHVGYARNLGSVGEIRAYKRQMAHPSYSKTTARFQLQMLRNCQSYGGCK